MCEREIEVSMRRGGKGYSKVKRTRWGRMERRDHEEGGMCREGEAECWRQYFPASKKKLDCGKLLALLRERIAPRKVVQEWQLDYVLPSLNLSSVVGSPIFSHVI